MLAWWLWRCLRGSEPEGHGEGGVAAAAVARQRQPGEVRPDAVEVEDVGEDVRQALLLVGEPGGDLPGGVDVIRVFHVERRNDAAEL